MCKLFLLVFLFHFSFGNIIEENDFYEIELPNDDNDPNHIKVLKIFQNNTQNYTLSISYSSEESLNNSFILNSNQIYELIECILLANDCDSNDLTSSRELYIKYYENGVFSLCIYKRYISMTNSIYRRTICLDRAEYKRFINIISFIFNKLEQ